jgi:hypothetical protein
MPDWSQDNVLQMLHSRNKAVEARRNREWTQARIHKICAREFARQERVRLARLRVQATEESNDEIKASEPKKP